MNTFRLLSAASALCAVTALCSSARAERYIDTFAAPLPLQTLPGTSTPSPTLWAGTLGGSSQWQDDAAQSGLSGVLGGRRNSTVMASTLSNSYFLSSTQANNQYALGYATGVGSSGQFLLEYGADVDLNANLVSDGSVGFELQIDGDMDDSIPVRPVPMTFTVASNGGAIQQSATVTVVQDGLYQIPFSSFPGVDFADVDYISVEFDATQVGAVDFDLIGGIKTTRCLQPSGSAVPDIMLDSFQAALPLRNLPGAGDYPMLWAGTWNGTTKAYDYASQSGLIGAIAGQRYTRILASNTNNFLTAVMSEWAGTPSLSYATGYPTSGKLELIYGAQGALNADLSSAVAFELQINGDLDSTPPRPVPLTVTLTKGKSKKSATVTLQNDGMVYVPFSLFGSADFSDVDHVTFSFDASQVQAVDFDLIGGIRASACMP